MSRTFEGFMQTDFDVFLIPGLAPRMEALIAHVRPKLEHLGERLAPTLSVLCGEELFPHVAKHARRTVHPPDDTWVAFANSKRGYKSLPHFQIGLWSTHVFIQFAVIYESAEHKAKLAEALRRNRAQLVGGLPGNYCWSMDHMRPEGTPLANMTEEDYERMIYRLLHVKKAEALCGLRIDRHDPLLRNGERFIDVAEQTFRNLLPLYRAAF
jgi:uncharacterized protein YktB (UPF0637 family)